MGLYDLAIWIYGAGITLFSPFHFKARQWKEGRRDLFPGLEKALEHNDKPVVWFHAASLGEFEQGRPVIENFRKRQPGYFVLLTFFSPSGYEQRKDDAPADYVSYLPLDTRSNARKFVRIVRPQLVVFIKYEFWFNFLKQVRKRDIPHLVISAVFREEKIFFRPWGRWMLNPLKRITKILVQDGASGAVLRRHGVENVSVCGDSRVDRVLEMAENARNFAEIENFRGRDKLLIAGSTWPADEKFLLDTLPAFPGWKLLLVPHDLGAGHMEWLKEKIGAEGVFHSENRLSPGATVMVVDRMGVLAEMYRHADLVYVGGGFGQGVHSLLEPAAHGKPVIFGPRHAHFAEAVDMMDAGCGFELKSPAELEAVWKRLDGDPAFAAEAGRKMKEVVVRRAGATARILEEMEKYSGR